MRPSTARAMPRTYSIVAVIVLAVLIGFGRSASFGFVSWDDDLHFVENPHLNPVSAAGLVELWTQPYERIYTPVPYTLWAGVAMLASVLDDEPAAAGRHPGWMHALNLIVHTANTWLVFVILRSLLVARIRGPDRVPAPNDSGASTGSKLERDSAALDWAACAGALLFGLHPLQVEAVAWASGLRDLSYAAFGLGALASHLGQAQRAAFAARAGDTSSRTANPIPILSTICFAVAVFAKPNAVALPFVAVALDRLVIGRPWRDALVSIAPWIPLALLCTFITSSVQLVVDAKPAPLFVRPFLAADAVAFYLGKLVAPVSLGIDYGRSLERVAQNPGILISGLVPAALAAVLWWRRREWPAAGVAFAVFVLGLLPALGLMTFRFQLLSTVADRYAYVAMLGPAFGFACALAARPGPVATGLGATLVAVLCGLTVVQTEAWASSEALYRNTLRANPESVIANHGVGDALLAAEDYDGAVAHYQAALAVIPRFPRALNKVGWARLQQGRSDEALPYLVAAAREFMALGDRPGAAMAHSNMGQLWLDRGVPERAGAEYQRAIDLDAGRAWDHVQLGGIRLAQGLRNPAVRHFRAALALDPDNEGAKESLAVALAGGDVQAVETPSQP